MTQYLLDTLVWTGALIALVLVLRRPVARHFGPQAAYALWTLPLLRLVIPPITLPAWMRPAEAADPEVAVSIVESTAATTAAADGFVARSLETAPATLPSPVDLVLPLLALWFLGVVIFLARRFSLYFRMRRELLAEARPVGDVDNVRLVETPGTLGPVAFGVRDKVIALPDGFMVQRDRLTRDLAIAHELAHHRGHDLLVNFLVQPLFALHWFNPLGWAGWRALRRDQEAACDARVLARRDRHERAAYAGIIAGFATTTGAAPRHALAAPMACPVLGDKSIIHRLRSLTMSDISPRRRFAGRALLTVGALALPLTASITYAETVQPEVPEAPEAPDVAVAPPAPPAPPSAPDAPLAPEAPGVGDADGEHVYVIRREIHEEEKARHKAEEARHEAIERRHEIRRIRRKGAKGELSEKEFEEIMEVTGAALAEAERGMEEALEGAREAVIEIRNAERQQAKVRVECGPGDKRQEMVSRDRDGTLVVCDSEVHATALAALKQARDAMAKNKDMSKEMREEVLSSLDAEIAEWKRKAR